MKLNEFIKEYNVSVGKLANEAKINRNVIYRLLDGKCITLLHAFRIEKATKGLVTCSEMAQMITENQ